MSHYNIAVTVGPNIFRPKELSPADFVNAGTFYDIFIRFMENFDVVVLGGEGEPGFVRAVGFSSNVGPL